jgi:16S rRNA G966 N2-methylase RsmD
MRYPGSKVLFVDDILDLIKICEADTFIEPFGGTGIVSLEASKLNKFSKIILNDINENVMCIHTAFKYGEYEDFHSIVNEIWSFGNPIKNKEDYYNARDTLNKKYFNTGEKNAGFYYLAISYFAINSLCRFGPNGFNQGHGSRGISNNVSKRKIDKIFFNELKNAYSKIELTRMNYVDLVKSYNSNNTVLFMDPPYVDKTSGTYDFTEDQYKEFINIIENWNGPVIYTDTEKQMSSKWNKKILRDNLGKARPSSEKTKMLEMMYYNFTEINKTKPLF